MKNEKWQYPLSVPKERFYDDFTRTGEDRMKLLKVKEICSLTGLTRKQLYDYRHLVAPVDYENMAGYKLYDESAVEKFKQIALLRGLEMPLKEIELFLKNPEEDGNRILETHLEYLRRRARQHQDMIHVAEYMQENHLTEMKQLTDISTSVSELAKYLEERRR